VSELTSAATKFMGVVCPRARLVYSSRSRKKRGETGAGNREALMEALSRSPGLMDAK
jgi:hypothetical protein